MQLVLFLGDGIVFLPYFSGEVSLPIVHLLFQPIKLIFQSSDVLLLALVSGALEVLQLAIIFGEGLDRFFQISYTIIFILNLFFHVLYI